MSKETQQYCLKCNSPEIKRVFVGGRTFYHCFSCNKNYSRLLVIDPRIKDEVREGKHIHYSSGVFVRTGDKILFFKRIIYPFKYSIPSGHIDTDESPLMSAIREVREETGLNVSPKIAQFALTIEGDKCRRGADTHIWYAFNAVFPNKPLELNDEGIKPVFLTREEALKKDLVYPVRYLLENNLV